jgi:hypothetical protein
MRARRTKLASTTPYLVETRSLTMLLGVRGTEATMRSERLLENLLGITLSIQPVLLLILLRVRRIRFVHACATSGTTFLRFGGACDAALLSTPDSLGLHLLRSSSGTPSARVGQSVFFRA